jgi:hypothetical protein
MLQRYILIRFKKSTNGERIGEFRRRMLALRTSSKEFRDRRLVS